MTFYLLVCQLLGFLDNLDHYYLKKVKIENKESLYIIFVCFLMYL